MNKQEEINSLNNFLDLVEKYMDYCVFTFHYEPYGGFWYDLRRALRIKAIRGLNDACHYLIYLMTDDNNITKEMKDKYNELYNWLDEQRQYTSYSA